MQKLKSILLPALSLLLICLICSAMLAVTNKITSDAIIKAEQEQILNQLSAVITASSFSEQKQYSTGRGEPYPYYDAFNEKGERIGRAIITTTDSYGGILKLISGVDLEGKITAIDILEINDTPGLGMKVDDENFLNQFKGISKEAILAAGGQTGASLGQVGLIDAISGATVSSGAVSSCVNTALEINALIDKGADANG